MCHFNILGHDWKSDLTFTGETQKKFSYVTSNQAGQDVTLEEVSGTNIKVFILNGGIVQGAQSIIGRSEPLRYRAIAKNGKELLINGKTEYIMGENKSGSEVNPLIIHNTGESLRVF